MYQREFSPSVTFTGVVITSNAGTGAVTVVRESYAGSSEDVGMTMQGIVVSSIMSTFLGFRQAIIPQPGSRVLCAEHTGTHCYVIGIIPDQALSVEGLTNRAMLGAGDASQDSANNKGFSSSEAVITDAQKPSDVVDGEFVVSNEFGVLLGLYQQLANLKGSELAQVQCFLLDDLVRVISHNFQHYTALGEYNIYHDGKTIMAEFGATHKPAESYGQPAVNADTGGAVFKSNPGASPDDSKDWFKFEKDERVRAIERFKLFLGGLGDFVNMFIIRPAEAEQRILDPTSQIKSQDTGLLNVHMGTDGGFHLRSLKEVFIEKTNWIRVPVRKAAPDDPNGDDASTIQYDKKELFKFDNSLKYAGNPFAYGLKLRDYVAHVNEKLTYQNFKKHEKDFHVNDSINEEVVLKDLKKIDKETEGNYNYELTTAGIYIMPNGGITIKDAWNSAIVMEGGNISIQPAKDLVAQPMRHSIVKAGGSVNIQARKHMDFSSTDEGVRIKSEKNTYIYSHGAGVLIEANGSLDTYGSPDPEKKKRALDYIGGVVIKSNLGIYNYAQKNIMLYAKGQLLLESLKNTEIVAGSFMNMYGRDSTMMFSDKTVLIKAGSTQKWVDRYTKEVIEKRSGGNMAMISEGSAAFAGQTATSLGGKGAPVHVVGIGRHSGVVDIQKYINKAKLKKFIRSREDLIQYTIFKKERREQPHYKKLEDIKFRFLESFKYGDIVSNIHEEKTDVIPGTLAQQEDLTTERYGFEDWDEKAVNESIPYPGFLKEKKFYYAPEKLINLEKNKRCKDWSNKANPTAGTDSTSDEDQQVTEATDSEEEKQAQEGLRKYLNKEAPSPYGDDATEEEDTKEGQRKSIFKKYKVFKYNERDPDEDRDLTPPNSDVDLKYSGPFFGTAYEKHHFINGKGMVVEDYDETAQDNDEEKALIEDEEELSAALKIPQIKFTGGKTS